MPYKYNPFSRTLDLIQQASPEGSSGCFQTGSIIWWPQNEPPEGWLKCDGSLVSKVDYPDLFNVIGYTFGEDDPSGWITLEATHTSANSETGFVTASSKYSTQFWPSYAVDDNEETGYCSATNQAGEWWDYKFNVPTWVDRIRMLSPSESLTVKIEGSYDDSGSWTELVNSVTTESFVWVDVDIPAEKKDYYKHYRITSINNNYLRFKEITFQKYNEHDPNLFGLPNISTGVSNVIAIIKT